MPGVVPRYGGGGSVAVGSGLGRTGGGLGEMGGGFGETGGRFGGQVADWEHLAWVKPAVGPTNQWQEAPGWRQGGAHCNAASIPSWDFSRSKWGYNVFLWSLSCKRWEGREGGRKQTSCLSHPPFYSVPFWFMFLIG